MENFEEFIVSNLMNSKGKQKEKAKKSRENSEKCYAKGRS